MTVVVSDRAADRLSPLERLEALCDTDSIQVIRSRVISRRMGDRIHPGDGVLAAAGRIDGRPVFCYSQDARYVGGSLGEAQADTIVRVLQLAGRARVPVVSFVESGGARMQEGVAALAGYGRIFYENVALSGKVPQISVITGVSAGGASYSPALTDFVVMTPDSAMFLTGPAVVRSAMGEEVEASDLGGPRIHERNGVCHFPAGGDTEAAMLVRHLLSYLPSNVWEEPPELVPEPPDPVPGGLGTLVPPSGREVYDVRTVIRALVDGGRMLEVCAKWARNMVCAFARVEGNAVGVIANQPKHLGGVIDAQGAQKAARFVSQCNEFRLPLLVFVDTPGFLPGTRQEAEGVIRHGACLLHAFAEARVPRFTVILRKAYGGAYITMNSRELGAQFTFAWPSAEIGVMGAASAVGIIRRRELADADDVEAERERLSSEYAERHLQAAVAAREGHVDEIIEPEQTRERLRWALSTLPGRLMERRGGR